MKIAVWEQIKFNIKNKLARTFHFSALFSTLSVGLNNVGKMASADENAAALAVQIHALCILHKDERRRHYAVTLIKM